MGRLTEQGRSRGGAGCCTPRVVGHGLEGRLVCVCRYSGRTGEEERGGGEVWAAGRFTKQGGAGLCTHTQSPPAMDPASEPTFNSQVPAGHTAASKELAALDLIVMVSPPSLGQNNPQLQVGIGGQSLPAQQSTTAH